MNPPDAGKSPESVPAAPETRDMDLREVKVKLPVEQVLRLHYARMRKRTNFSTIVSSALTRYLDDLSKP